MAFLTRLSLALVVSLSLTGGEVIGSSAQTVSESRTLAPVQVRTVAQSRCGPPALSTAGTNCQGFDAREIRAQSDVFVVGYENNQGLGEKHVLQVVVVFDLGAARGGPGSEVSGATLQYAEGSTSRRLPGGESQDGTLPTCNTALGVPVGEWNGRPDTLVRTRPAATAGAVPATTGDHGAWNVTPQLKEWLASGKQQGTLVLRGDDESPDIHEQAMCLSYVADLSPAVEHTVVMECWVCEP